MSVALCDVRNQKASARKGAEPTKTSTRPYGSGAICAPDVAIHLVDTVPVLCDDEALDGAAVHPVAEVVARLRGGAQLLELPRRPLQAKRRLPHVALI